MSHRFTYISGVPGSHERNIILPSSYQRRAALSHLYSCHSIAHNPVCFSVLTQKPDHCSHPHLEPFQFVFWDVFNHCTYTLSIDGKIQHRMVFARNDRLLWGCEHEQLWNTHLCLTDVSNIIPRLIFFSWFFLISDIFYLNLKSHSRAAPVFHFTVSICIFLLSSCVLCLNHRVPSQGYY